MQGASVWATLLDMDMSVVSVGVSISCQPIETRKAEGCCLRWRCVRSNIITSLVCWSASSGGDLWRPEAKRTHSVAHDMIDVCSITWADTRDRRRLALPSARDDDERARWLWLRFGVLSAMLLRAFSIHQSLIIVVIVDG